MSAAKNSSTIQTTSSQRNVYVYTATSHYKVLQWNSLVITTEDADIPIHKITNVKFFWNKNRVYSANHICHPIRVFGGVHYVPDYLKFEFLTKIPISDLKKKNCPKSLYGPMWCSFARKNYNRKQIKTFVKSDADLLKLAKSNIIEKPSQGAGQSASELTKSQKRRLRQKKSRTMKADASEDEDVWSDTCENLPPPKEEYHTVPPFDERAFSLNAYSKELEKDSYVLAGSVVLGAMQRDQRLVADSLNFHIRKNYDIPHSFTIDQLANISKGFRRDFSPFIIVKQLQTAFMTLADTIGKKFSDLLAVLRDPRDWHKKTEYKSQYNEFFRIVEAAEIAKEVRTRETDLITQHKVIIAERPRPRLGIAD